MRLFLSLFAVQALMVAVSCENNDDETAKFIFNTNSAESDNLNLEPQRENGFCATLDGKMGICVPYYKCMVDYSAGKSPRIIGSEDVKCPHYMQYCCKMGDIAEEIPVTERIGDFTLDKQTATLPSGVKSLAEQRNNKCGWSNTKINIRIPALGLMMQNTPFANFGDFPFMVALMKKSSSQDWTSVDYLGGGTLIHPSVVMTVAHKLSNDDILLSESELKCRAGEWDTSTIVEQYGFQERNVAQYIIHENYYRTSLYNDIALVFLESSFDLTKAPHIGPGCLATAPLSDASTTDCYSMGWGKEQYSKVKTDAIILKKVKLQIIEARTCEDKLKLTWLGRFFKLHDSLMCAVGYNRVETCRGDGGSPLVCSIETDSGDTRYAVYGMVAYGLDCHNPEIPGVYVKVSQFKNWVEEKMQLKGYTAQTYTI